MKSIRNKEPNIVDINWDKLLIADYKHFSCFKPDKKKIKFIGDKFINECLFAQKKYMPVKGIWPIILSRFLPIFVAPMVSLDLVYEVGDFDGIIVFRNILPEDKCSLLVDFWNEEKIFKESNNSDFIQEGKALIKIIMDEFKLKRIEGSTTDKRIVKFSELFGFQQGEIVKHPFPWNDLSFLLYKLEITQD